MGATLTPDACLKIATSQLERAWRMAKGLHLLKARLQAIHHRMLGGSAGHPDMVREWIGEMSDLMRAGGIPAAVEQLLMVSMQQLKAMPGIADNAAGALAPIWPSSSSRPRR